MRQVALVLLCVCLLLSCTANTAQPGTPQTPLPAPEPGQGLSAMIGLILQHPEQYEGQQVTLVGYFRGLDLLDESAYGPPANRSRDWVVTDDSGAIWVAHQDKLPFPSTSHEVWRIVRVSGTIALTDRGQIPYIIPTAVEWEGLKEDYSVLPASCKLAFHRFGGPDQVEQHIYWYASNQLVIAGAERTEGRVELTRVQIQDLDRAFRRADLFDLSPTIGDPCTGCVRYQVAAINPKTDRPHFVTAHEGSIPQSLQALIDELLALAAQAEPI